MSKEPSADKTILELEPVKAKAPHREIHPESLRIAARIRQLSHEKGFVSVNALRLKTVRSDTGEPIDNGQWYNMLNGYKTWSVICLQAVAVALKTTVAYLKGWRPPIPIVGEPSVLEPILYKSKWQPEDVIGWAINDHWEDEATRNKIYALRAKDGSLLPFSAGTIFYAQHRPNPEDVRDMDYVVWCDPRGRLQIRQIELGPEIINLRSLNPAGKSEQIPRRHLDSLDLIVKILHSSLNTL